MRVIEEWVENDVQHVVEHAGQQLLQEVVALLEARIGVDFYQVRVQLLVHDEIVAKELERQFLRLQLGLDCSERQPYVLHHGLPELLVQ